MEVIKYQRRHLCKKRPLTVAVVTRVTPVSTRCLLVAACFNVKRIGIKLEE